MKNSASGTETVSNQPSAPEEQLGEQLGPALGRSALRILLNSTWYLADSGQRQETASQRVKRNLEIFAPICVKSHHNYVPVKTIQRVNDVLKL